MKISTLAYSIRQGLKNIRRNKLFSLASVGTIAACIFLLGMFYAIVANFQYMIKEAESAVSITVFFNEGTTEEQITQIGDQIKKRAEVADIQYTSAEQAWEDFKKVYFADAPELAEGFKDDNPLANSAFYEIHLNDVSLQPAFVSYVKAIEGVRQVNYSETAASSLTDFGLLVAYVSVAIIVILIGVGVFLISNTVMIGIAVRKEEIGIMKLIGATDFFVKAPFIVEGIIIGLTGAMIPLIAIYFIYKNVVGFILEKFQNLTTIMIFLPEKQVFAVLIPMALLIGGGIGFAGSMLTIRKHLRV